MDIAHAFWSALQMTHRVGCLVRGHDLVMQYDKNRLALRCLACGYRTRGWALNDPPPQRRATVVQLTTARRVTGPRAA
jgi:hypothetical protein